MRRPTIALVLAGWLASCLALGLSAAPAQAQASVYPWLPTYDPAQSIESRIPAPAGFERMTLSTGCFGEWLRRLPLKAGTPEVMLYNGQKKANQAAHIAVLDIDVGDHDLQQCADAVIRLRAEYDFARQRLEDIHFQFTSGDVLDFLKWCSGTRPLVAGNRVQWVKSPPSDWSHPELRKYLDTVFQYAGSISLGRELEAVKEAKSMKVGDVFIKAGSPGHAVLVVDMACDPKTGRRVFLLAQSFIPAQDIHVLKNPRDAKLSPWYDVDFGAVLSTPEWTFARNELKRFPRE
jgi:hypothetical protein